MKEIKLDPRKLLGFKIIADGSTAKLSSPKIGDKDCVVADEAPITGGAALRTGIGTRTA